MQPADLVALDPGAVAILVDFDGSLAPVVERPENAVPLPAAVASLERLTAAVGLVGVVSGRPVEFLLDRLPVSGLAVVGQYGLERASGEGVLLDARVTPYVSSIAAARAEARSRWPDLYIEEKGVVAFTVHWRSRPDRSVGREVQTLAASHGLETQLGRMACEVRPPVGADKGTAVYALIAGYEGALFAGDDAGDLPAFAAIATAPVGVRVGVRSREAPPELEAAVDVMVDGPSGLVALFDEMVDAFTLPR